MRVSYFETGRCRAPGSMRDAGHEAARERPEAFTDIVGDFLTRGEAFPIGQQDTALFP